ALPRKTHIQDRLTHVQLLFTWNLSPLRSFKFSLKYLLLPPRSALEAYIRQVSCYTVLSGFRLPWPPSCCQDVLTPFVVSDERPLRHLNLAFGSSRIASSAYQKWPTSVVHSNAHSFAPMPIFDDRFARQNRCEPPPEFPLASPYTGIVHLLS
ncbi:hypothetical protein PSTG_17779, partial [Puccinia striiformis f. sp. tritici PST-78]